MKVNDIASDYLSNYIVISVKPLILNYAASLHYTRLNLTLNEAQFVNISSGIVNETHEYAFMYMIFNLPNTYVQTHTPGLRVFSEGRIRLIRFGPLQTDHLLAIAWQSST